MIPVPGINPFGLEDRKVTFHVTVSGKEIAKFVTTNRMYCWLSIPSNITAQYGDEWVLEKTCDDKETFDGLTKYVDKSVTGNHYMVEGNVDLYSHQFGEVPDQVEVEDGFYATVFIIDTSGSTASTNDRGRMAYAITAAVSEYACTDKKPKLMFFNGVYPDKINEILLLNEKLTEYEIGNIYSKVFNQLKGMSWTGRSEAMLSVLYYAINYIIKNNKILRTSKKEDGENDFRAISFVLLTDEQIFTSDTFDRYTNILVPTNPTDAQKSSWIYKWQTSTDDKCCKFPSTVPSPSTDENKQVYTQMITDALKQMSYYTGVNLNWGLSYGVVNDTDGAKLNYSLPKTDIVILGDTIPFIGNWKVSGNNLTFLPPPSNITNNATLKAWVDDHKEWFNQCGVNGEIWHMPFYMDGEKKNTIHYHVSSPMDSMCQLVFRGATFKPEKIMSDSDQYTSIDNIKGKVHKWEKEQTDEKGNTKKNTYYCMFRYFTDNTITLPDASWLTDTPSENNKFVWRRFKMTNGKYDPKDYELGANYVISENDVFVDSSIWFDLV